MKVISNIGALSAAGAVLLAAFAASAHPGHTGEIVAGHSHWSDVAVIAGAGALVWWLARRIWARRR